MMRELSTEGIVIFKKGGGGEGRGDYCLLSFFLFEDWYWLFLCR